MCIALSALAEATVEAKPTIVALSPQSVEILFKVGAGEQIIGTVDYADYPQAAQLIPRLGRYDQLDMETLMLLQPQLLVFAQQDTSAEIRQQLETLGVPIIDTSVSTIDQVADQMALLGAKTGHSAQGAKVAAEFRQQLAQLRQQYQGKAPLSVFYQVWPEPLTTTSDGWMNQILTDCGGHNVFADAHSDYPQVSMEQVLVKSPQVILKPKYEGATNQERVSWTLWPELPAVANGQVITLDGDVVHRTGPRVVDGMKQICQVMDDARNAYAAMDNTP
ncbi:cobalamin-binding protein [Ferrimonas lipolytica]|uniref:Cobalamin-binding protein n=2 Tax=Ferrimonas lipolytica TaxID=2724191 RepID=A0A6H1UI78_9GAMM|nr:cobalamin-binding protein [Ferrimonas lipolytica]